MIALWIALGWILGALWVLRVVRDGAQREAQVRRIIGGTWTW